MLARLHLSQARSQRVAEVEAKLSRARETAGRYEESTDNALAHERARAQARRALCSDCAAWERLLSDLPGGWSASLTDATESRSIRVSRVSLSLRDKRTSQWPQVVQAVRYLEGRPEINLVGLQIESVGDKQQRSFREVRIVVDTFLNTTRKNP